MEATGLPFALVMRKGSVAEEGLNGRPAAGPPARPPSTTSSAEEKPRPAWRRWNGCWRHCPDSAAVIATNRKRRARAVHPGRPAATPPLSGGFDGLRRGHGPGHRPGGRPPRGGGRRRRRRADEIGRVRHHRRLCAAQPRPPVLDNGTYDSTAARCTVSPSVDFARVAVACGYATAFSCDDRDGFTDALQRALAGNGPHLVHMRIAPGSMKNSAGRPSRTARSGPPLPSLFGRQRRLTQKGPAAVRPTASMEYARSTGASTAARAATTVVGGLARDFLQMVELGGVEADAQGQRAQLVDEVERFPPAGSAPPTSSQPFQPAWHRSREAGRAGC